MKVESRKHRGDGEMQRKKRDGGEVEEDFLTLFFNRAREIRQRKGRTTTPGQKMINN